MAAIFRKPGQETWWVTYYVNGLRGGALAVAVDLELALCYAGESFR
jgi:hypothetical protein